MHCFVAKSIVLCNKLLIVLLRIGMSGILNPKLHIFFSFFYHNMVEIANFVNKGKWNKGVNIDE